MRNVIVTQFNQLNLNSSFSIVKGWIFIKYKDKDRHHEEFSNIFSSKVLRFNNGAGWILPGELSSLTPNQFSTQASGKTVFNATR